MMEPKSDKVKSEPERILEDSAREAREAAARLLPVLADFLAFGGRDFHRLRLHCQMTDSALGKHMNLERRVTEALARGPEPEEIAVGAPVPFKGPREMGRN